MGNKDKVFIGFSILIFINLLVISSGQNYIESGTKEKKPIKIIWCTISHEEQQKCHNFASANERDKIRVGYDTFTIECLQASSKSECMTLLDDEKATLTTLDAGEVFIGGRYTSLIPIAQEVLEGGFKHYYSVAVIKKGTLQDVTSLQDLRGRRACFAGVEKLAGWVLPIYTLMREGGMEIVDCNNHVKSAIKYFGPSCAVNSLTDKFNPIGDNSDKLCQLCIGRIPGGRCTNSDPYAGYEGAFRCLLEIGDIAFLRHTTIPELVKGDEFLSLSKDSFELLCKDGTRRPVDQYFSCNWGRVPSNAIVTSSISNYDIRQKYQTFLSKAADLYGKQSNFNTTTNERDRTTYDNRPGNLQYSDSRFKRQNYDYNRNNQNDDRNRQDNTRSQDPFINDPYSINRERFGLNIDPYENGSYYNRVRDPIFGSNIPSNNNASLDNTTYYEVFHLFESTPRYGIHGNLLFEDSTRAIAPLNENQQTYTGYLGSAIDVVMGIRDCPVNRITLCVTSDAEKDKCIKMKIAMKAQLLKPEMDCYKGHSQIHCMQAIRSGVADVTVLDASDVYTAGLNFELVPFISEVYNLDKPEYYVVAVGKESDPSTELTYLKGKYTCHGGINTAAGWVYPLAFLISNGWIRSYGCDSIRAAAEYFQKSCAPGALSTEYNTGVPYDNMCDLCHGVSYRYCRRDASEDYYGHTGAFRCLVEGGGHVAFVKHTTVIENTGGKRKEWWARDNLNDDFELLCPDGTRAEINEYTKCNLGRVKANAIVTRGGYGYNETHINAYINLFLYAQTFYGKKTTDEFSFSMFSSTPPFTDLIFQDATTQLKVIKPSERYYSAYLGNDFMRARRIVDCHAGSAALVPSLVLVFTVVILINRV